VLEALRLEDVRDAVSYIATRHRRAGVNELLVRAAEQNFSRHQWVDQGIRRRRRIRFRATLLPTNAEGGDSMTELLATTRTELAHRSTDGLDVTLVSMQGGVEEKAVVCVYDRRQGAYLEIPTEPHFAVHVYYHPFAYRDLRTSTTRTVASRRSPR
jgi:hypothetical protein